MPDREHESVAGRGQGRLSGLPLFLGASTPRHPPFPGAGGIHQTWQGRGDLVRAAHSFPPSILKKVSLTKRNAQISKTQSGKQFAAHSRSPRQP